MKFLKKLFFLGSPESSNKIELFICSDAIDFLTWYKTEKSEGTMLHCFSNEIEKNQVVEGLPETINQIAFDGLFYKCTAHYVSDAGVMKKFSCWINPDNISSIYTRMPDDCQIIFDSGQNILIASQLTQVMKTLFEHNKKLKERRKLQYGK